MSECHKIAIDYETNLSRTCGNVWEMSSDAAAEKTMESNRNFIQLIKLIRGKDQPLLLKWLERKEDRYTSHDIQNEIIPIMANHFIRDLVSEIRVYFFQSYATSTQISVTRNN